MDQHLTFDEIERIGSICRRQRVTGEVRDGQLLFRDIELLEMECRQLRSEAIAGAFSSLFKKISTGISAAAAAIKPAGHPEKPAGAAAR